MLMEGCLTRYGGQVRILELGKHIRFLRSDCISTIFRYCPFIEELCYPIFFTKAMRYTQTPSAPLRPYTVKHVRLHATMNVMEDEDDRVWEQINSHFTSLCGHWSRFKALERVTLHGQEWGPLVADPRFVYAAHLMHARGVSWSCADETVRKQLAAY